MRSLRYSVAASLDGYIAGPNGEFDWIVVDPEIDFEAMHAGVSGLVMGRKSYEISLSTGFGGGPSLLAWMPIRARSPKAPARASPSPTTPSPTARALTKPNADGKLLWPWGGGELFRHLAEAGPRRRHRSRHHPHPPRLRHPAPTDAWGGDSLSTSAPTASTPRPAPPCSNTTSSAKNHDRSDTARAHRRSTRCPPFCHRGARC